jgi:hypothetical protein
MKRAVSALAAMIMAAVLVPAAASAAELQIGVTSSPVISPTCPADAQKSKCTILLTQVTSYETLRDGVANPDVIKKSGEIASFTLGLASPSIITPSIFAGESAKYGGAPEAQLTVLRPTGTPANPTFRVAAESAVIKVGSELGKVAEFPLTTPLPVVRGEVLALTVPTWAPVLSFELDPTKFAYAQSKPELNTGQKLKGKPLTTCEVTGGVNLAQIVVGELASYGCTYPGTRAEYSALEITTPAGFTSQVRKRLAAIRARGVRVIKRY